MAEYCGDKGVDEWTDSWWKKEMDTTEVIFCAWGDKYPFLFHH